MATESWKINHRPHAYGNPTRTRLALSTRQCVGCRQPLTVALLSVEPDAETHPCCTQAGPITDWQRWAEVQRARQTFEARQ